MPPAPLRFTGWARTVAGVTVNLAVVVVGAVVVAGSVVVTVVVAGLTVVVVVVVVEIVVVVPVHPASIIAIASTAARGKRSFFRNLNNSLSPFNFLSVNCRDLFQILRGKVMSGERFRVLKEKMQDGFCRDDVRGQRYAVCVADPE